MLRRDAFERQALADRQALIASGRVDDLRRLPTVDDQLEQFDAFLVAEPERTHLSTEQWEERVALGVA